MKSERVAIAAEAIAAGMNRKRLEGKPKPTRNQQHNSRYLSKATNKKACTLQAFRKHDPEGFRRYRRR